MENKTNKKIFLIIFICFIVLVIFNIIKVESACTTPADEPETTTPTTVTTTPTTVNNEPVMKTCYYKECDRGACRRKSYQSTSCDKKSTCTENSDCQCTCNVCRRVGFLGFGGWGCGLQSFSDDNCPCEDTCSTDSRCGGSASPDVESECGDGTCDSGENHDTCPDDCKDETTTLPVTEPTGCPSKYIDECSSTEVCPQGHQCISGGKTYCDIICKKICSMTYAPELENTYRIIWCRKDTTCECQEKVGEDFGCFQAGQSCYGAKIGCTPSEPTPLELEPPEKEPLCIKEGKIGNSGDVCCEGLKNVGNWAPMSNGECTMYRNPSFKCTNCGDGKCGLGEDYCNCPEDCEEETICTDSDGGKDYYVKGEITGELVSGEVSPSADLCFEDGIKLMELFCNDKSKGESIEYDCSIGCEDGACVCDAKDTLAEGASKTYIINGFDYNVNAIIITNVYPYQVKFKVNGYNTDAMQEGHIFKLPDGAELAVTEILQSEAGDGTGDLVRFCLNGKTSEEPTERITIIGNYIILNENFPDDVYSSPIFFYTGVLPTEKIVRTLINFDLSSLEGKEIRKTELVINKISMLYEQEYGKQLVGVHKVTGPWDTTTACWNNQPGFDTAMISSKEITENGKYTFSITPAIMDYLIAHEAGLLLKAEDESKTSLKKFDEAYLNIWYTAEEEEQKNCGNMGGNCRYLSGCRDQETYTADYECLFWGKCCMPEEDEQLGCSASNYGSGYENSETRCSDGLDNDCDGLKDCADSGCSGDSACHACIDNDGDGYGTPASSDCTHSQLDCNDDNKYVNPGATEICNNNIDDDCNGLTDSKDPDCRVIDLGLILDMPFDIDSSTTAKDYSVYNNNGKVNGATWTPNGKVGGAYVFDGYDDAINIPDSNLFDFAGKSVTISVWIKGEFNAGHYIMEHWVGGTPGEGWNILTPSWGYGGIYFEHRADTNNIEMLSTSHYDDSSWHNIVVTLNEGIAYLYFDGKLEDTDEYSNLVDHNEDLHIGTGYITGYSFKGTIDEVKIYDYPLSAEQILQNYIGTSTCTPGSKRLCAGQEGVCSGSSQTCTAGGTWPGCDESTYSDWNSIYEIIETVCNDQLDNDCDGLTDSEDLDCGDTLTEIAYLQQKFDDYFYKNYVAGKPNPGIISFYDSYFLKPYLAGFISMYEATQDEKYIVEALDNVENLFSKMIDVDNNGYLEWVGGSSTYDHDGNPSTPEICTCLYAQRGTTQIARLIRVIKNDKILNEKYGNRADHIKDLTLNIVYHPECVNRLSTNWHSTLQVVSLPTTILLELYLIDGNSTYLDIVTARAQQMKNAMFPGPDNTLLWGATNCVDLNYNLDCCYTGNCPDSKGHNYCGIPDVSHEEDTVGTVIELYRAGIVFTKEDVDKLVNTFLTKVWNGNPSDPYYYDMIDGRDGTICRAGYVYGTLGSYIAPAWVGLGAFNNEVQSVVEAGDSSDITNKNWLNEMAYYAEMARNKVAGDCQYTNNAKEICDGKDNDCDDRVDENLNCP